MQINEIKNESTVTMEIDGRIDTITSPILQEKLLDCFQNVKEIDLDFSKVSYISSAGLRVLLLGHKTALSQGGTMKLLHVSELIMEVLSMTGFDNILQIEE